MYVCMYVCMYVYIYSPNSFGKLMNYCYGIIVFLMII